MFYEIPGQKDGEADSVGEIYMGLSVGAVMRKFIRPKDQTAD